MTRPLTQALVAELDRYGITDHRVEHGGKHPRLVFSVAGAERPFVMPGSGFDGPARYVYVGELRKLLHRLGVPKPERAARQPARRGRRRPSLIVRAAERGDR